MSQMKKKYVKKAGATLDFQDKHIITLWMMKQLPPSPQLDIDLDLNRKQLQGKSQKCQEFKRGINKFLSEHLAKVVKIELKEKHKKQLKKKFNCSIFTQQDIWDAHEYIKKKYNFDKIQQFLNQKVFNRDHAFLVCLNKDFHEDYNTYIQQISDSSGTDSDKVLHSFYETVYEKKQSQNLQKKDSKNEKKKIQYMKKPQKIEEKSSVKKIEKTEEEGQREVSIKKEEDPAVKQILFEEQYSQNVFDVDEFKKWTIKNRFLDLKDFEFLKKPQTKSIIVKLILPQLNPSNDKKKEATLMYFKFERVVIPNIKLREDHICSIVNFFCSDNTNYISCEVVKGYWQKNLSQTQLRMRIKNKSINKTNKNRDEKVCFLVVGFEAQTKKRFNEIHDFIENLPKDNKTEQLFIHLQKIKDYLDEDKVKKLLQKICQRVVKNNNKLLYIDIQITSQMLVLIIQVQYEYYEEFMKKDQHRLIFDIQNSIFLQENINPQQVQEQLKNELILLPSEEKHNEMVLIEESKNMNTAIQKICNSKIKSAQIISMEIQFKKVFQLKIKQQTEKNTKHNQNVLKVSYEDGDNQKKMTIIGPRLMAKKLQKQINNSLLQLEQSVSSYSISVEDQEFGVVNEHYENMKKSIQDKYNLYLDICKNVNQGSLITMGKVREMQPFEMPIVMLIKRQYQLSNLPFGTNFIFRNDEQVNKCSQSFLNPFKIHLKYNNMNTASKEDNNRGFLYFYSTQFNKINELIEFCVKQYPHQFISQKKKRFALFMPDKDKRKFILELLSTFEEAFLSDNYKIQIYIFDDSTDSMQKVLKLNDGQKIKKWYVQDGNDTFYYSEAGNRKLRKYQASKKKKAILFNQDLNLNKITHKLSYQKKKLTHWQNQVETDINFVGDEAYVLLKNIQYKISSRQVNLWKAKSKNWSQEIQVSLGIYQIDLVNDLQTNLFSGFQRKLKFQEIDEQSRFQMELFSQYNFLQNQINVYYGDSEMNIAKKAELYLKDEIKRFKIIEKVKFKIDTLNAERKSFIKDSASQNKVKIQFDEKNSEIILVSYDKISINTFIKMLPLLEKMQIDIKYPQYWQPQIEEIDTFVVDQKTDQFKKVQDAFTLGKINELVRIQNKLVYKKYYQEQMSLMSLNEGKEIQQKLLYHGTRTTNPEVIYTDKQESFNINYTSDRNFLGKGTYFAVQSSYSDDYSYRNTKNRNVFSFLRGQSTKQMLYCSVLVGDSQQIPDVDDNSRGMKDTDYKDPHKKIRYESSTIYVNGSRIYAVYKNRRAYPQYLIRY